MPILALSAMLPGQEADMFVLMTSKEQLTTREGKPYYRVGFRDGGREVVFPIWDNSPWAAECRDAWTPGTFYKVRAVYRETNYGPQLDIRKIREVCDADAADGFDPTVCLPQSRYEPQRMFEEMLVIVRERITDAALRALVEKILIDNRDELLRIPAARHNHHAFVAGWLEHTLSVTRTVIYLADKYAEYYDELEPPLDKSMAVAGAILHDVGKLRELEQRPEGTVYTASGALDRPLAAGPRHRPRSGGGLPFAARHALAAGASYYCPSATARMGLAQAAHDARGPLGALRRRHRRQVPHDGRGPPQRHQRRAGDIEEECADAAGV